MSPSESMPKPKHQVPPRYRDLDGSPPASGRPQWFRKILRLGASLGFLHDGSPRLSTAEHRAMYHPPPSFARFLPLRGWDPRTRLFLTSESPGAAAVLELDPVDAEARSQAQLEKMLDSMTAAFTCIPRRSKNPWIVQLYLQDEPLIHAARRLREYAAEIGSVDDRYSSDFFDVMHDHLIDIGNPGGIFEDSHTGIPWGGRMRRCRLVLYRRFEQSGWPDRAGHWPIDEVDDLANNLSLNLETAGIACRRIAPGALASWMFPWLNPSHANMDAWDYLARHGDPDEHRYPFDLCNAVLKHSPVADLDNGAWWLSGKPHRYLPVIGFRSEPRAGLWTLERSAGRGRTAAAIFDRLPTDTVLTQQIVFVPEDEVTDHLDFIGGRSRSDNPESALVRDEVANCLSAIAQGNLMFPTTMGFFVRGADLHDLEDRLARIQSLCTNEGMETVEPGAGVFPLDEFIRFLPAGYDRRYDRYLMRERYQWLANSMAASPLWGKGQGSGKPGFTFFDRAGQPVMLDILHEDDHDKAPHALIVGPTGTGKSALLNYLALQILAVHRPHVYIVDVGDSFRLLGDYLENRGLSVNYVRLDREDVSLPPFSCSAMMLEQDVDAVEDPGSGRDRTGSEDDELVDYLGDMEAAARMIITGLDRKEEDRYSRRDRTFVRAALIDAAILARERGDPHASISDFVRVLEEYVGGRVPRGFDIALDAAGQSHIQTLHANAMLFLDGVRSRLFNRPGNPWPEVDVTIVDFGRLAQGDDNRDILAIAFIGLMNTIQRDAERRRRSDRQSVVMIDEAHLITNNPHLAGYLVRGSKMWRKWGLWLWLATQSLADFPDDTRQILNMCEFWFALSMPKEEIREIARFRNLSDEDRQLLEEARRSPGRYSEGVLLSTQPPMLFRNVPPAIAMALAQTEQSEVAERHRLMQEHDLATEIDAVDLVAERIRERRLS